jgi:hypothetical protein
MRDLNRRSFVGAALAAFPPAAVAQTIKTSKPAVKAASFSMVRTGGANITASASAQPISKSPLRTVGEHSFSSSTPIIRRVARHVIYTTTKMSGSTQSKETTLSRSGPSASI